LRPNGIEIGTGFTRNQLGNRVLKFRILVENVMASLAIIWFSKNSWKELPNLGPTMDENKEKGIR